MKKNSNDLCVVLISCYLKLKEFAFIQQVLSCQKTASLLQNFQNINLINMNPMEGGQCRYCTNCGSAQSVAAKFCSECGQSFNVPNMSNMPNMNQALLHNVVVSVQETCYYSDCSNQAVYGCSTCGGRVCTGHSKRLGEDQDIVCSKCLAAKRKADCTKLWCKCCGFVLAIIILIVIGAIMSN